MYVHSSEMGVQLGFALLRRWFPFHPIPGYPSLEVLSKKYQKWEFISVGIFLLVAPACVLVWYWMFGWSIDLFIAFHRPYVFFLMLERPWFLIPSIFLGI